MHMWWPRDVHAGVHHVMYLVAQLATCIADIQPNVLDHCYEYISLTSMLVYFLSGESYCLDWMNAWSDNKILFFILQFFSELHEMRISIDRHGSHRHFEMKFHDFLYLKLKKFQVKKCNIFTQFEKIFWLLKIFAPC